MLTRDEYVEKMEAQLDNMDVHLDQLGEKLQSAKQEMQAEYEQKISDVRAQSIKARVKLAKYKFEMADIRAQASKANSKLEELRAAGEDSWYNMVAEMDKVGDGFNHSSNYFKSQV